MRQQKSTADLLLELNEYQGGDKIISSYDMRALIGRQPKTIPVMSRLPQLDRYTGGFLSGELIAISGPRKAGKTLFAQTLTVNFAKQDIMSLWFSYELSSREFINRFPGELPVFVMPAKMKANSLEWLRHRILEGLTKYGVKMAFIDHLHYLFDLARMRNTSIEIGQVIRTLKMLAVELNITIFFNVSHG